MRIFRTGYALSLALTCGSSLAQGVVVPPGAAPPAGSPTTAPAGSPTVTSPFELPAVAPAAEPPMVKPTFGGATAAPRFGAPGAAPPVGPGGLTVKGDVWKPNGYVGQVGGMKSGLVISFGKGEINLALAGPDAVPGAFEAAHGIIVLDGAIAAREAQLTPQARQAMFEFRELAATQLSEGLTIARSSHSATGFPQAEAIRISYLTQAALTLSNRIGPNRVTTYIKGPDDSWNLDFITWEEHRQNRREWRPYAYGNPLDIKTYVFRVRGSRSGSATECEHSVPVWDDPTRYTLAC